jgi:transcription antitermination factor NusG
MESRVETGHEPNTNWFALRVKSHCERMTAAGLRSRGYEEFLPTYRRRRRWSDRWVDQELPLFPGYVFCRFDPRDRLPILKIPSLVHIVGIGKTPLPVDEHEIEAIQAIVRSGLAAQPWPYVKVGDMVRVQYGSLCGLEGILIEVKKRHRLVVSVTLLQRSVAVEIDRDWVSLVRPACRVGAMIVQATVAAAGRARLAAR